MSFNTSSKVSPERGIFCVVAQQSLKLELMFCFEFVSPVSLKFALRKVTRDYGLQTIPQSKDGISPNYPFGISNGTASLHS